MLEQLSRNPPASTKRRLELGWFLPTSGDTSAFGVPEAESPASPELFERIVASCERAGFEYLLIPVQTLCWEAWITAAWLAGRCRSMRPLIAARPGYIQATLLAKMVATLDQLTAGRVCVNLIAGASEEETRADGITLPKETRYEMMAETVELCKQLWTSRGRVTFEGHHVRCEKFLLVPRCVQEPHPPFYLGGGSRQAWEISAKHSNVHLFWGDTPPRIAEQIDELRTMADQHGRREELGFGMRLQIICRETEDEAWRAAQALIQNTSDGWKDMISRLWSTSEANQRMKELGQVKDFRLGPHLWSGLTTVRPGAGVAVVGNPRQVAATLREFIDVGCHSFCLSGYPHDEEADRFGRLVRPLLVGTQ